LVKANKFASIAKKVMDKPLMDVPAHPFFQPGTGPSSSCQGPRHITLSKPKMSGCPKLGLYTEDISMGVPDKGKGYAVPKSTTKDAPMNAFSTVASKVWIDPYLEALWSNNKEWDNFEEEAQAEMVKATTNKTA